MSEERTRLLLTLAAAAGFAALAAFLRRRRAMRRRAQIEAAIATAAEAIAAGNDALGDPYITLGSLEEARTMDHTAVVLRGDGGRHVYLTVPVKYVGCDERALKSILHRLDALECNDASSATVRFELAPIGSGLGGAMGGGAVVDGLWLHPRLNSQGIFPAISDVIYGRQAADRFGASPDRTAP